MEHGKVRALKICWSAICYHFTKRGTTEKVPFVQGGISVTLRLVLIVKLVLGRLRRKHLGCRQESLVPYVEFSLSVVGLLSCDEAPLTASVIT